MNTNNFVEGLDGFVLLNLTARCEFKTETSISFILGEGTAALFRAYGRIEVHHPCGGHFNVRLKFWVPISYLETLDMASVVRTTLAALGIAEDETHEAIFFEVGYRTYHMTNFELTAGLREFVSNDEQKLLADDSKSVN